MINCMFMYRYIFNVIYTFYFSGAEEEEVEEDAAAAVVVIEDAEAAEGEVEVVVAVVIEIIKTPVVILVKTWIISNLNILDMDIENVIRIIETREGIKEAVAAGEVEEVAEVEVIAEIPAATIIRIIVRIIIRIIIKVTVRIINSRNILAREIHTEVTIGVEIIIKTGEKVVEEGEAEFKVDGIKVPIPVRIAINVAATTGAEEDNTKDATLHIFLMIVKVSHEEEKLMILKSLW